MNSELLTYHVSLGSNLGERITHLYWAVKGLSLLPEARIEAISSVYSTGAHVLPGSDPQPDYLNAVVRLSTLLQPAELLVECLRIEAERGRDRTVEDKWVARTLDLDLILCGSKQICSPDLTLPHPRLSERLFVLLPLSEIDGDLHIPAPFDQDVRYLLEHCPDDGPIERLDQLLKAPYSR